ncbi:chemotaxis protein CheW [Rhizobium lusitanum]|uniref:chemotaxis protein CheW n=1 Tax=Rhizobium lusitanum TaxID=293958 RepID=UPI001FEF9232|nr:chemotaxis protein CheW [Rhizobium lusitanum]
MFASVGCTFDRIISKEVQVFSMPLSGYFRRAATAVRVHDTLYMFVDGTIVARADNWRPLGGAHDKRRVLGHSSYRGELVPVYDLAVMLGREPSKSCQIVIVKTTVGHVAFLVDEYIGSISAVDDTIRLSHLDIFHSEQEAA